MGVMEWLTALTLGRGHYEEDVILTSDDTNQSGQLYNERGYPKNPETKRRERENVRAANEVMLVTGVVENSEAARIKKMELENHLVKEDLQGLRLLEAGRFALIGGVWGVLGLRKRILLYKSYADMNISGVLRHEASLGYSIPQFFLTGFAPLIAYQTVDMLRDWIDPMINGEEGEDVGLPLFLTSLIEDFLRPALEYGISYAAFICSVYAILQHLHLISPDKLFPPLRSFIPFSQSSPFRLPPAPSLNIWSIIAWSGAAIKNMLPLLMYTAQGRLKFNISNRVERYLYFALPRPQGILKHLDPHTELTSNSALTQPRPSHRSEDASTLRALEGLPASDQALPRPRTSERETESTDDDDDELHPTLISFDVEATEPVGATLGTWSAELRSTNDNSSWEGSEYRMTQLTIFPTVLATQAIGDVLTWIIMLPFDAWCVRVLAHAYRNHADLGVSEFHKISMRPYALGNLFGVAALQLSISAIVWTGFTLAAMWVGTRNRLAEHSQKPADTT